MGESTVKPQKSPKKHGGMKNAKVQWGRKDTFKTFGAILLMCAWVFVSVVAVEFIVSGIMYLILRENFNQPVWTAVYSAVVYLLALFLIIFVPPKIKIKWQIGRVRSGKGHKFAGESTAKQPTKADLGIDKEVTWMDILLSPVAYVVATLLAAALIAIFSNYTWFNAGEAQSTGFGVYMNAPERLIAFFTLVVAAPVAEELIFRGWLYDKIRTRLSLRVPEWAGVIISILIVSVLFGIVHMQWNVGVNVFALSVILCLLREVTGSIYAGIFTHMIKNAVAFYLLYILGFGT